MGQTIIDCFSRHERGEFGDLSDAAFDANLDAIAESGRIQSIYRCDDKRGDEVVIHVVTDPDRGATELRLAEEG